MEVTERATDRAAPGTLESVRRRGYQAVTDGGAAPGGHHRNRQEDASVVKRMYYFTAGIALGVAASRRTRRAKEAAKAAFLAKFTPSAIAADVADAIAEIGQAVGSFASDVRMGAVNRRASYRPVIDGSNGNLVMVPPELSSAVAERHALASGVIPVTGLGGDARYVDGGTPDRGGASPNRYQNRYDAAAGPVRRGVPTPRR